MTRIALFDFDHTLIVGDSFMPFLAHVCGWPRVALALVESLLALGWQNLRGHRPEARTFIKAYLLRRLLAGKKRDDLRAAAVNNRLAQVENRPVMAALHDHVAQGDIILIASGGLDLYLPEMLRDVPHDALICTDIGVADGIVTGEMINGNCVRQCKAERVAAWLKTQPADAEIFAYGNYPHDVPMLQLARYRIIVS